MCYHYQQCQYTSAEYFFHPYGASVFSFHFYVQYIGNWLLVVIPSYKNMPNSLPHIKVYCILTVVTCLNENVCNSCVVYLKICHNIALRR